MILGTLIAAKYREIFQPFFEELRDDELRFGYFQQDGATPHTINETLNLIREFFDRRIISRHTQKPYLSRSLDTTLCDFFLWPYLKNSIFQRPIHNLDELRHRIVEKIEEINDQPNMLINVFNGMRRRIQMCLQEGGGHFDYLL